VAALLSPLPAAVTTEDGVVFLQSPDGLAPPPCLGETADRSLTATLIPQKNEFMRTNRAARGWRARPSGYFKMIMAASMTPAAGQKEERARWPPLFSPLPAAAITRDGFVLLQSPDGLAPPPCLGETADRSIMATLIAHNKDDIRVNRTARGWRARPSGYEQDQGGDDAPAAG
jgi:hypothetical protein